MRTVKPVHRKKVATTIFNSEGEAVGAELKEQDTYHVTAFAFDLVRAKARGSVSLGHMIDGQFAPMPQSQSMVFEFYNNPQLGIYYLRDFVAWCGGNIMENVTARKFLDYLTDVLCWLPEAELTPDTPAHTLQKRGFFDIRDYNYHIEPLRLSENLRHKEILQEWEQGGKTKEDLIALLDKEGMEPYDPKKHTSSVEVVK